MSAKLRVLHFSSAHSWRGGEQQIAYLVENLYAQKIWQLVFCVHNGALHRYCLKNNWRCVTYTKIFSFNVAVAYRLKQLCVHYQINIIHLHDPHAHNFAVLAADIFANACPLILSRRVDFPIRQNWYSQYKYHHAHIRYILCVSKGIQHIVARSLNASHIPITTVYSGIKLSRFTPITPKFLLRKNYHININKLLIGNVAALAPHKDYYTFVDTAKILIDRGLQAHFFIIGEGNEAAAIQRYIHSKQLDAHITLTGFRNDIPEVLPQLDIFLVTSETEGLGTSIIDACACKVPVVATNTGGIPEIIVHEKTGLLAPPKNALALSNAVWRLQKNQSLRTTLANAAYQHIQQFSVANMAKNTLYYYRKVYHTNSN